MIAKLFKGHSRILFAIAAIVLISAFVFFVVLQKGVKAKEAELGELQLQLKEIKEENSELEYLINDADEAELFEHLARERGLVYPDEKVYYNVTPGN